MLSREEERVTRVLFGLDGSMLSISQYGVQVACVFFVVSEQLPSQSPAELCCCPSEQEDLHSASVKMLGSSFHNPSLGLDENMHDNSTEPTIVLRQVLNDACSCRPRFILSQEQYPSVPLLKQ